MRNRNLKSTALKTRDVYAAPVSPCAYYTMHEGTGILVSDKFGNGPDLTLVDGASGTPWSNVGALTPNGTSHYLHIASDTLLQSIFRFDGNWAQKIFCIDYQYDGAQTGYEAIISAGLNADSAVGSFVFYLKTNDQFALEFRGIGSSAAVETAFDSAAITAYPDTRLAVVLELLNNGNGTCNANLYYNGILKRSRTAIGMKPNGGSTPYGSVEGDGYHIGAQGSTGTTKIRLLNSQASNARISDVIMMSRETVDATLALKTAAYFHKYAKEFPLPLAGK